MVWLKLNEVNGILRGMLSSRVVRSYPSSENSSSSSIVVAVVVVAVAAVGAPFADAGC